MTFEKLLSDLTFNLISPQKAFDELSSKEKMKTINYYAHINDISKNPLKDDQLQELNAIVRILQILYNSKIDSPVSDETYDSLQETLIDMGIPRLTGSIEINDSKKVSHKFTNLRGTLDKVYYLYPDEERTNKSRKYLDEWINSTQSLYKRKTGKDINLNDLKVIITPKMDGCFPGNTKIYMSDGTKVRIDTIVNNHIPVEVLSYNFNTNTVEAKRVINWYKYDTDFSTKWVRIKAGPIKRDNFYKKDTSNGKILFSTPNHKIFTLDTEGNIIEKMAIELNNNDKILEPKFILSNIQEQIIRGSIMGDGSIQPKKPIDGKFITQSLHISHKLSQLEYIQWKKSKLGYLGYGMEIKKHQQNNYSNNKYCYVFGTHRSNNISRISYEIDNDSITPISYEFLQKMNSLGLAIWYMDDGSLNKSNKTWRANIHTEAFGYEENEIIKSFLDSRGYYCNILKHNRISRNKTYFFITMTPEGSKNFWTDISHFIVPSMQYKLPDIYKGRFIDIKDDISPITELDYREIEDVDLVFHDYIYRINRNNFRYDLEIEDNHNYFANGILVHNSSSIMEFHGDKPLWLTRGDTSNNRASDVSHIMNIFNDVYGTDKHIGQKFEIMVGENAKDKINELSIDKYKNSRQIVTSIMNSLEPDFKVNYLFPVPLRIMEEGKDIEDIHPMLIEKFPTLICKLSERDKIKEFANNNKYVNINEERLRTDGIVITIMDENVKRILGRDNNINNFEVAYKFTEEYAYTKVKDVEFYVSEFNRITPVLVVNDVILKGNTINHISLSNKERFDELDLHYGDEVKVLYDIIPYVTIDNNCKRFPNGRKIEFINKCPVCKHELDLSKIQVQCTNLECPSRIIGRIMNYCNNLRIQNIGYSTIETLYKMGLLKHGIRSLYKLKKKTLEIQDIEGFGVIKTKKIINEIESKRRLFDYELFGAIGIESLSIKTFKLIFSNIKLIDFMNMIKLKNYSLLLEKLVSINGIGGIKASVLVDYLKDTNNRHELEKLLEEIHLEESFNKLNKNINKIVFSGCRPNEETINYLNSNNYEYTDNWINSAKYLIIPNDNFHSSKIDKAKQHNVQIISLNGRNQIDVLKEALS